jgi:ABC-type bacteriocin/lantibiotic exporter with double-glycine peptidase domain
VRYIFGILMTASPLLTGTLLILSVVGGLTVLAELWAITHLVDEIAVFTNWSDAYMEVIFHFSPYLAALIGAMLVQQFMYAIQPYLAALLNERTSISLNNQTFIKSMKLRLESFESEIYFDKLERSRRVQQQLVRSLIRVGEIISAIMQFIVILYAISRIGALYAVLLVLCCVPIAHFSIKGSKRFIQVNYEQSQTRRKQGYWRNLATNREAAAELRLFQLGTFVIENWQLYTKRLINELMQARKKMALFELKGQVAFLLLLFVMMGATVFAGLQGTVSLGAVIATLYLLDRLQEVMIRITYSFNDLIKFFFDFQVVPEFLQLDDEEKEGGISAFNLPQNGIRFENVSFTYPGQNRPALDQVSFHVRAGERIALAGENGAGKSTLCLLLLGLYRPTEGRIWIDGIDLSEINIAAWRKRTAAVFQNYMRYQLTAGENIAFGDVEKRTDTEKVEHAAAQSGIHPVIEQWPKDTLLCSASSTRIPATCPAGNGRKSLSPGPISARLIC